MKCHQILTGAANRGDRTFGVGSVEGVPFTAYAAGCNLVILSSTFERVQIIPGVCHNDVTIRCLAAAIDTGKVAAAYDNKVIIFEPTPLRQQNSAHGLDYWWVETGRLVCECALTTLSWNNEGNRLITAGEYIQLWHHGMPEAGEEVVHAEVKFHVGGDEHHRRSDWNCLWKTRPANRVIYLAYSPDGTLFATAGKHDRLVRVWYQNQQLLFPLGQTQETLRSAALSDSLSFSYIYLAHPRSVTGISWRTTSKYMPKGSVANMLVTSCLDNVCRLWCETMLPEDGVISLDPGVTGDAKFRTHRQKARFIQRFRHMRQSFAARKLARSAAPSDGVAGSTRPMTIPSLPSTYSVHDFHSYGFHAGIGGGISPGLHFHLAATINAASDIPLVPHLGGASSSMASGGPTAARGSAGGGGTGRSRHNFVLHWLNNKEMQFTMEAESIMEDLFRLAIERGDVEAELTQQPQQQPLIADENAATVEFDLGGRPPPPVRPPPPATRRRLPPGAGSGAIIQHTGSSQSLAQSDSGSGGHHGSIGSGPLHGVNVPGAPAKPSLSDMLDNRIDRILNDWHQNSDLLFSVHPVDGSLLVWVADYLDEYLPGSFRQAQVSFSSRIPNALPLGDAMTMGANVELFNTANILNLKELLRGQMYEDQSADENRRPTPPNEDPSIAEEPSDPELLARKELEEEEERITEKDSKSSSPKRAKKATSRKKKQKYDPPPVVSMISKHTNGTLNLWNIMFAEKSKFSQLLNISHSARASGHRFRVNGITCHPVLPLLLTTSHHNLVASEESAILSEQDVFCSELILWRVDPVGPLSKSGGITELARINSKEVSAFCDVAWIPTLLPSTTMGSISNSPSACFVASDGRSLRVYQAIIDARTLLAEINAADARRNAAADAAAAATVLSDGGSSVMADEDEADESLRQRFNIVSTQSTARPGAIVELEAIADAARNWQSTLMLHAFQEQLILAQSAIPDERTWSGRKERDRRRHPTPGASAALIPSRMSAVVDLQQEAATAGCGGGFREPFYALVAEKDGESGGVLIHMWRLVVASEPEQAEDTNMTSGSITPDATGCAIPPPPLRRHPLAQASQVHVSIARVCTQNLPLPEGVEVIHAVPAVGHLSSSSIYPACLAPYVMVTACSDSTIRFWRVKMTAPSKYDDEELTGGSRNTFEWQEWRMENSSADGDSSILVPGRLVSVSAAYSGRIACAYQTGHSFQRRQPHQEQQERLRYVNLCIGIYECESTGGSEWHREDVISLRNIELAPEMPAVDLSSYEDAGGSGRRRQENLNKFAQQFASDDPDGEDRKRSIKGLMSVPSLATLEGVKRYITKMGNTPSPVAPKQSVMLDWVSNEDGSHILTVAVGNKVLLLTAVSSDISQASMKAVNEARSNATAARPLLRKSSSMGFQQFPDEIRWMQIRRIALRTADGLNPTPMSFSWVRDGVLMCAMDNEIAVYSQWREDNKMTKGPRNSQAPAITADKDIVDHRNLKEADILSLVTESRNMRSNASFSNLPSTTSKTGLADPERRKKGVTVDAPDSSSSSYEMMPDFGLFEAAHIACPVLPQYHPKQLMELLYSGKIRWVKAILGHLVRCIGGPERARSRSSGGGGGSFTDDGGGRSPRGWSRSRTLSVSYGGSDALSPGGEGPGSVSGGGGIPEELTLDYAEISSVPPLPLWTLLAADKETGGGNSAAGGVTGAGDKGAELRHYDDLFSSGNQEENLDSLLEEEEDDFFMEESGGRKKRYPSTSSQGDKQQGLSYFGPRQARILSKLLTHAHLPGLTSLDQMHLLALADTVASCQLDLADRFAIDAAKRQIAKETIATSAAKNDEPSPETLDDCGLRFLLAMKHFAYLQRCLPLTQRVQLQKQGMSSSHLIWAFHSESEEELLAMIPSVSKGNPTWAELRELGVGWWLRSNTTLRRVMEKVAKTAFQASKDPLDAAVFYLAMKKKSLVWGLYRSIKDERMTQFFSNDFTQDRWRRAAMKNAFALLGKQRFLHAAAFFLLSGSLKDAVDICLDKLDDFQLAMVVARLYDGEMNPTPDSLKALLNTKVLGRSPNGDKEELDDAHPDPFLRSIALWINKEYAGSLATLVQPNVGTHHPKYIADESSPRRQKSEADPGVFNFYVYLRTHPLIARHQMANKKTVMENAGAAATGGAAIQLSGFDSSGGSDAPNNTVTPLERRLYFSTAHFHLRGGCPALAVQVLSKLPNIVLDSNSSSSRASATATPAEEKAKRDVRVETGTLHHDDHDWMLSATAKVAAAKSPEKEEDGTFDWGAPVASSKKLDDDPLQLDWSQPVGPKDDDELKLEWSDDPDSEYDDDDSAKKKKGAEETLGKNNAEDNDDDHPHKDPTSAGECGGMLDIMAQQLKFIACLKIMMEELSTLATGFEVDGGVLRYQLYIWLEREVEALKQLCSYGATDVNLNDTLSGAHAESGSGASDEETGGSGPAAGHLQSTMRELYAAKGRKPTLHEVMMAEKVDFEVKVKRANKRKRWLRANQTLLRTLLSYCGLHGANGGGLASVRMELILLLQELQQEKTQKQLQSPLPFPTTLPLLSACIAQQKTVVTDPVRHLQAAAHDMLKTVVDMGVPPFPSVANYNAIFLLRDLSVALSSCIYQALCDSDSINMKKLAARDGPASAILEALSRLSVVYQDSSLISTGHSHQAQQHQGRKPSASGVEDEQSTEVITDPCKWPGVTSLRALLDREKDEETPSLSVLLCETFVAVYLSLFSYALSSCDAQVLYRLVSQKITPNYWAHIFGGGARKTVKVETSQTTLINQLSVHSQASDTGMSDGSESEQSLLNTMTSITKQRVKLNLKVLGMSLGTSQENSHHSGGSGSSITVGPTQDKLSYREQFVPPEMSVVSKLMSKPTLEAKDLALDYDSGCESDDDVDYDDEDEAEDDDNLDPFSTAPPRAANTQHSDPNSYAWTLIRYACVKLAQTTLERFIAMAGIELPELPVASPLIYACLRISEAWLSSALSALETFGVPPDDFIPGCFANPGAHGPAIEKYRSLFELHNTPFKTTGRGIAPVRRLWQYLVRQSQVQIIFVKFIFGRRGKQQQSSVSGALALPESQSFVTKLGEGGAESSEVSAAQQFQLARMQEPVKVIHKDRDAITAFCINKKKDGDAYVSTGLMTVSTQKELQELNISLLLNPSSWDEGMNEEADFDVLSLNDDPDNLPASAYLVIQTPGDLAAASTSTTAPLPSGAAPSSVTGTSQLSSPGAASISSQSQQQQPPFVQGGPVTQTGKGTVSFLEFEGGFNPFEHKMKGLHFPGSQNPQFCRLVLQRSRQLLKPVRRHRVDGVRRLAAHSHLPLYVSGCQDGSVRMWEWSHGQAVQGVRPSGVYAKVNRVRFTEQGNKFGACDGDGTLSLWQAANASKPFFSHQCHSKQTSDFVFQGGCSSLLCTAGHSADGRNVALWDTLAPKKRCLVQSFTCHESGASALAFAPRRQRIVSAGKRGAVAIWDVRAHRLAHTFKAHDHAVKCLAVDPAEEFFVTGSVAGDIKIWSMNSFKLFHTFPEEHSRQGIFKNISQGVSQVFVDQYNRLFSCGADGSMKVRQLPDRDFIVDSIL